MGKQVKHITHGSRARCQAFTEPSDLRMDGHVQAQGSHVVMAPSSHNLGATSTLLTVLDAKLLQFKEVHIKLS